MKSAALKLSGGHFNIIANGSFNARDISQPFLSYSESGVWHCVCRPERGIDYDAEISLGYGNVQESIFIAADNCAITACPLTSGTASISLKNSSAEFETIKARRIDLSLGLGSVYLKAAPSIGMNVECGAGIMNIMLKSNNRGYYYIVRRGLGNVIIQSRSARRNDRIGKAEGIPIQISCGLGTVNISEY